MKIVKAGDNCASIENVSRAAFLIDAENYFRAFRSAVLKAERQILITGWDVDSRVKLVRGKEGDEGRATFSALVDGVVKERQDLEAFVLIWDFAMLYALEREALPVFKLGWQTSKRVHFHMDAEHPIGASHHQKIVVIDDKIAFVGGLDITRERWDTRAHRPDEPLRRSPAGTPYGPFHDVQVMVEGDIAKALGDIVRDRWFKAKGEEIKPPGETSGNPWPEYIEPELTDASAAIALTYPEYKGRPEVRQVEDSYVDAIMAAKRSIYFENQYFSSQKIAAAIGARLREEDGPEIVMVQPYGTTGWLEESTMGVIRAKLVKRLKQEDNENRFRLFHAVSKDSKIKIHGKVMVVDDQLLRVGSANLSNRSMGLDSECDLIFEAENEEHRRAVRSFRNDLLGEHLGRSPNEVEEAVHEKGSFIVAIESLAGGEKTLKPLHTEEPKWGESIDMDLFDPERPVKLDRMIDNFVHEHEDGRKSRWLKVAAAGLLLAALAFVWRFTDFGKSINIETVTGWAESIRHSPFAPLYVIVGFLVASLVVFPVTILVIVSAAVFPPLQALGYMLAGVLVSSLANYYLGQAFGRDMIRRFPGGRLNRLSKRLAKSGIWAIIAVRNLPVAPYTVVNAVAGATHIRLRDFLIGTLLGMLPGLVAVTFFTDQLAEAILDPEPENIAIAVALGMALFAGLYYLKRRLRKRESERSEDERI